MLLRCESLEPPMSQMGHNPNPYSALARPAPPGADMVGESDPLVKLDIAVEFCARFTESIHIRSPAA
jgi:hypothetical protein